MLSTYAHAFGRRHLKAPILMCRHRLTLASLLGASLFTGDALNVDIVLLAVHTDHLARLLPVVAGGHDNLVASADRNGAHAL